MTFEGVTKSWTYIRRLITWLPAISLLIAAPLQAVIQSENYRLPGGSLVSIGASNEGRIYRLVGSGPVAPAGPLVRSNGYEMFTGVLPISLAYFLVDINLGFTDTVAATNQPMIVFVTGGVGQASGSLHFRPGGDSLYSSQPFAQADLDSLEFPLTPEQLTIRGLEYYLTIDRGVVRTVGDSLAPFEVIVGVSNQQARAPQALPEKRYRMVGVPVNVTANNDGPGVFGDDLGGEYKFDWRMGRWSSAADRVIEHPDADPIIPGRAYWLISGLSKTFGAGGLSVHPNYVRDGTRCHEVPLDSGWNQIANPFSFCIDWSDVLLVANDSLLPRDTSVLEDVLYAYGDNGFSEVAALDPWIGVFIHLNRSGVSALFPFRAHGCNGTGRARAIAGLDSDNRWTARISLSSENIADGGMELGLARGALRGRDQYDFTKPPPAPNSPWVALKLPDREDRFFRTDYRPLSDTLSVYELIFSEGENRELTIETDDLSAGVRSVMLVLDVGTMVTVAERTRVKLPDDCRNAQVMVGSAEALAAQTEPLLPEEHTLMQNFPNPFNPATAIRYALPSASYVKLVVFNSLGQEVVRLLDQHQEAGVYTVDWDGRSRSGSIAASGVYFYRLEAKGFEKTRKMVLVK